MDDFSGDIGESEFPAVVDVGEAFVVEPKQVEDGSVEVINAHLIDGGLVSEFIGGSVVDSTFDAGAGHPVGEGVRVVIAPGIGSFLRNRQPSEFASPDDEGFVQQSTLLQVGEQSGDGLVCFAGKTAVVPSNVFMAVPASLVFHAAGINLHKTHASFDHPPRHHAL